MDLWLQIIIGISVGTACGSFIWVLFSVLKDGIIQGIFNFLQERATMRDSLSYRVDSARTLSENTRKDYVYLDKKYKELKERVDKLDPKTKLELYGAGRALR